MVFRVLVLGLIVFGFGLLLAFLPGAQPRQVVKNYTSLHFVPAPVPCREKVFPLVIR